MFRWNIEERSGNRKTDHKENEYFLFHPEISRRCEQCSFLRCRGELNEMFPIFAVYFKSLYSGQYSHHFSTLCHIFKFSTLQGSTGLLLVSQSTSDTGPKPGGLVYLTTFAALMSSRFSEIFSYYLVQALQWDHRTYMWGTRHP